MRFSFCHHALDCQNHLLRDLLYLLCQQSLEFIQTKIIGLTGSNSLSKRVILGWIAKSSGSQRLSSFKLGSSRARPSRTQFTLRICILLVLLLMLLLNLGFNLHSLGSFLVRNSHQKLAVTVKIADTLWGPNYSVLFNTLFTIRYNLWIQARNQSLWRQCQQYLWQARMGH